MEAWKRRGQSRSALGQDLEAIQDLTRAADLAPKDSDVFYQRGLILFKMVRACSLALSALSSPSSSSDIRTTISATMRVERRTFGNQRRSMRWASCRGTTWVSVSALLAAPRKPWLRLSGP